MGWDAFAKGPRGSWRPQPKKFKEAHDIVLKEAGTVDCFLSVSGLDCSACRRALEAMTGFGAFCDWDAERVQEAFKIAKPFIYDTFSEEDKWAYASAYHFLRVCAENNLSVEFSY